MQRLLAIAWLTWKAAFRFRLFLVIAVLLLAAVVGLPMVIQDDGTARGFTQILLTYTLSAITGLLGLSTLWLACGTLARDIEECQMQVVATKPIARWQIWLGKWLGIMSLNAALLALSGACVYGLLQWRAAKLPAAEQTVLREQVLVARGSAKERNYDAEIDAATERILQGRLKNSPVDKVDVPEVRKQIREQVKADFQLVPPGYSRQWQIDLGFAKNFLKDKPLQLRVKFNSAQRSSSGTFVALWQVGVPETARLWRSEPMSLAPNTFHEFQIPPNLFDDQGVLTIIFVNPNDTSLLFPLEDGMEVLYPRGRLHAELCARSRNYFLLDGAAGGAGIDGGELFDVSGRGIFLAGGSDDWTFQRDTGRGGGIGHGDGRQRGDRRHGTFGGGRGVDPAFQGLFDDHQSGEKFLAD